MAKDWVEQLLKHKSQRYDDRERQAKLETIAVEGTPEMFRRLALRVRQDCERFAAAMGKRIGLNTQAREMEVQSHDFPSFWLKIEATNYGINAYRSIQTSSSHLPGEPLELKILIIARAVDQLFYRLDGQDYADESEVSEILLKPYFEMD